MSLAERAAAHVVEIHDLFVALLTGRDRSALEGAMARMSPGFVRVAPDATVQDRAAVEAMLAAAAGKVPGDFVIEITIEEARDLAPGTAVVRYREDQRTGADATSRRSTAVFVADDNGQPLWASLQETWVGKAARSETGGADK